jgi:hypothetical protein
MVLNALQECFFELRELQNLPRHQRTKNKNDMDRDERKTASARAYKTHGQALIGNSKN